ncbi:ectoine hydroxylase-related dioxygenase (phytanoyl-CoA dioxygenase family) [Sinobacterium caligoides]|uniref:Ectoine hydroxylase-related dioxygenase (Phytanoyl-CoA dioxygenase family) n=1 Tax=Sinobacterium caligoides TaxID=933926 RepID=A0A3N2DDV3_9GAMM|nr:phytanoyl-CoA dioxygenase family protein [Sinobacterium caligoides]ROR97971.1 ectoine hydroxylase-related dioxygenase (phytanoyl-CoA dioxygenase family) [Sinobacterium caligoides]
MNRMNQDYEEHGYFVQRNFFSEDELRPLKRLLTNFHHAWQQQHASDYAERAVNSAYITGREHLNEQQRLQLFHFIASTKLMRIVNDVLAEGATFMNSQLFFDPANPAQKNYWHRDPQYHLSIDEQKTALSGPEVVHLRIPLVDEPGIELIPGSHRRWDSNEELAVRLQHGQRKNYQALDSGVTVELAAGDLLVFSANMIHRGLYGMDRLSFDILFCDPEPDLLTFIADDCLPEPNILEQLEDASAFEKTLAIKAKLSQQIDNIHLEVSKS